MKTGGDPDTGEPKGETGEPMAKRDPPKSPKKPKDEADTKTGGDPDTGSRKVTQTLESQPKPKGTHPSHQRSPKMRQTLEGTQTLESQKGTQTLESHQRSLKMKPERGPTQVTKEAQR